MAMSVSFKGVLLCDTRVVDFEGKKYYQAVIYSDGSLKRISIPSELVNKVDNLVGSFVSFQANMSTFDNRVKFKLVGDIYPIDELED